MKKNILLITSLIIVIFGASYYYLNSKEMEQLKVNEITRVSYDDMHGLWGGYKIDIDKKESGALVRVEHFDVHNSGETKKYEKNINQEDLDKLIQLFSTNNFLDIENIPVPRDLLDASSAEITVTYKDNTTDTVSQEYNNQTQDFLNIGKGFLNLADNN